MMPAELDSRAASRWPWVVFPAIGALWATLALRRTYFFYDEWSMIDRVMHVSAAQGTMASFNGHLWMLQYWLYRIQVSWFGLDDHLFISFAFVLALILLHLAVASVMRAAGTPLITSVLVGGLLTYLGVASQNFVFAIQTSTALAMAFCLAAAAVVLRWPPAVRPAAAAAILMLVAVGLDSGTALLGIAFAVVVMIRSWRSSWALAAVPSVVALAWWYLAGDLGPDFPAPVGVKSSFALHLALASIGGLIGQGQIAGLVIVIVSGLVIIFGLRRRLIVGPAATVLMAGTVSTATVVAVLAQSRAAVVGSDFVNYNRYLQSVAIPATVAVVPSFAAVARGVWPRTSPSMRFAARNFVAPAAIVGAFVLGIAPMRSYTGAFRSWNEAVQRDVGNAMLVLRDGCASGIAPDPASHPIGDLSPQVTTQLLSDLMARGALHMPSSSTASADVVARMCPDAGGADG